MWSRFVPHPRREVRARNRLVRPAHGRRRGGFPDSLGSYRAPLLAVAGGKESRLVRKSFPELRRRLPQTVTWIAPGMHHVWSIENIELFTRMTLGWVDHATIPEPA